MMTAQPFSESIPVYQDEHGRLRVGDSRVLLDLIVYSYRQGNTPETIIEQYPSLSLDQVYFAIGYYLRHSNEVDAYLQEQEADVDALRQHDQSENPPKLTREILLARLKQRQQQDED